MRDPISRLSAVVLFVALVSACAHTRGPPLTVDEVIRSNPEGEVSSVRGYLRFGDDSRNLWSSKDAYDVVKTRYVPPNDPAWDHCIALYGVERWRRELLARDKSYVVITGVIHRYPSKEGDISLGSCSDLGVTISSLRSD
jgi:hypothetical protein